MKLEDVIRESLGSQLSLLEPGLTSVKQNYHLCNRDGADGFIDILALDRFGYSVIIELKRSDKSAREGLHEILKYLRLYKAESGLAPNQIRCFIVSTTWHELATPFSEFRQLAKVQAEGFQIETTPAGEVISAEHVPNLPPPAKTTVFRQHGIFLYPDASMRDAASALFPSLLKDLGSDGYLLFSVNYEGKNNHVIYPHGLYLVPTMLSESVLDSLAREAQAEDPELSLDESAYTGFNEGSFLARVVDRYLSQSDFGDATFEIGYPEKATSMLEGGWVAGIIQRSGPFSSAVTSPDENLLKLVKGLGGANMVRFERLTSPKLGLDWKGATSAAKQCLSGNPTWATTFEWFTGWVEHNRPESDVLLKVYNPLMLTESFYRLAVEGDSKYLPELCLASYAGDGSDVVVLRGCVVWDGNTCPRSVADVFEDLCGEMLEFYFLQQVGAAWELDVELMRRHGFSYGVWRMEYREGAACGYRRLSFDDLGMPTESACNGAEKAIVAFINSNPGYVGELVRAIDSVVGRCYGSFHKFSNTTPKVDPL